MRRFIDRVFTRERPTRGELLGRVRERSFAIAMSNIALVIVGSLTALAAYTKNGPNLLLLDLIIAFSTILGFLASSEASMNRLLRGLGLDSQQALGDGQTQSITSRASNFAVSAAVTVMMTAIVLDFWAVGYLMRTTGGVVHSPYNTVPATMLILGGLMTRNDNTRVVIFILGMLFFLAAHSLDIFGSERTPTTGRSFGTFEVFVVVTAVNLIVSYAIASRTQALLPPHPTEQARKPED